MKQRVSLLALLSLLCVTAVAQHPAIIVPSTAELKFRYNLDANPIDSVNSSSGTHQLLANDGTALNAADYGVPDRFGAADGALSFSPTTDPRIVSSSVGSMGYPRDFTAMCWVRLNSYPAVGQRMTIFRKFLYTAANPTDTAHTCLALYLVRDSLGRLAFEMHGRYQVEDVGVSMAYYPFSDTVVIDSSRLPKNTWVHLAWQSYGYHFVGSTFNTHYPIGYLYTFPASGAPGGQYAFMMRCMHNPNIVLGNWLSGLQDGTINYPFSIGGWRTGTGTANQEVLDGDIDEFLFFKGYVPDEYLVWYRGVCTALPLTNAYIFVPNVLATQAMAFILPNFDDVTYDYLAEVYYNGSYATSQTVDNDTFAFFPALSGTFRVDIITQPLESGCPSLVEQLFYNVVGNCPTDVDSVITLASSATTVNIGQAFDLTWNAPYPSARYRVFRISGTDTTLHWGGDLGADELANITLSTPGTYTFYVQQIYVMGCPRQHSNNVTVTVTNTVGLPDAGAELAFTMAPNPTRGQVAVRLGQEAPATLTVRDLTGRTLLTHSYGPATQHSFSVESLPRGVYVVQVSTPYGTASRRLVRE